MRICIDSCVFIHYLIPDNRHFLRELQTDAFDVLDAAGFVRRWDTDAL